ncbi:MAG TPA: bifunctional NADH dehydrogenase FAD-containing subunit/selenide, water dikinase SelD, partial [Planctomycetes bacterium]|nr:bifunctional NADH dehydrogenase FAD-containing subunit/selenide, water dikinase SelD [Planctomycetota bacterium]
MNQPSIPIIKDLVLVGGGHSNIAVLKMFGMDPIPGVRLTLLTRDVHTPYSGMLPGFIAGHYDFDEAHIDLGPLCRFAGARLYHDSAVGIDTENQKVICAKRPAVPYDLLSINIGSTPRLANIGIAQDEVVPVKPISNFVSRWEMLKSRILEADRPFRIGTVGAGAGGVEITLAIQYALKQLLGEADKIELEPEFHLFYSEPEILSSHNYKVRKHFERVLKDRGVQLYPGNRVESVSDGRLRREDGMEVPLDEILWVTDAAAPAWLGEAGLDVDEDGFVKVTDCLNSPSHKDIFAAGDIAAVINHPRPKAGIFAVRQGMPLAKNLRNALLSRKLKPFIPQRMFLSLISTGDKKAVASKGEWCIHGGPVWRIKDLIDRRFMRKYNSL